MTHHPDSKRINKAISDSGYCSRRQADIRIGRQRVMVNNKIAALGDRIMPEDEITVDGNQIYKNEELVYIALNKPVGITCTTDTSILGNVIDFIDHKERLFHIGRLDKPSEGLLLLTNDGDIVNKILRAGNRHEKQYIVKVDRRITEDFIKRMSNGVPILETITKKCSVEKVGRYIFKITLIQGLNRQIRRMCQYLGYDVVDLQRIRIMNIHLGNLAKGKWRNLTKKELIDLKKSLGDSLNISQEKRNKSTGEKRR